MKKLLSLFLIPLLLCGCTVEREDYYIFSFGDYTIAPGYDDAEYLELIFELDLPETLEPNETLEKKEVHFWGDYLADVDLSNDGKKTIPIYRAYNPKLKRGKHHYTPSKLEYDKICKNNGWKPEGVKFYVIKK